MRLKISGEPWNSMEGIPPHSWSSRFRVKPGIFQSHRAYWLPIFLTLSHFFISRIVVPPAGYLAEVRKLCTEHGVLFICDEIQTVSFFSATAGIDPIDFAYRVCAEPVNYSLLITRTFVRTLYCSEKLFLAAVSSYCVLIDVFLKSDT